MGRVRPCDGKYRPHDPAGRHPGGVRAASWGSTNNGTASGVKGAVGRRVNATGRSDAGWVPPRSRVWPSLAAHPGRTSSLRFGCSTWTCGFEVTGHQLELLQPAREQPWLFDDATVARIIRVHRGQADDLRGSRTRPTGGRPPALPRRSRRQLMSTRPRSRSCASSTPRCWQSPPSLPAAPSRPRSPSPTWS